MMHFLCFWQKIKDYVVHIAFSRMYLRSVTQNRQRGYDLWFEPTATAIFSNAELKVTNPHFKWGFNISGSAAFPWFHQRRVSHYQKPVLVASGGSPVTSDRPLAYRFPLVLWYTAGLFPRLHFQLWIHKERHQNKWNIFSCKIQCELLFTLNLLVAWFLLIGDDMMPWTKGILRGPFCPLKT